MNIKNFLYLCTLVISAQAFGMDADGRFITKLDNRLTLVYSILTEEAEQLITALSQESTIQQLCDQLNAFATACDKLVESHMGEPDANHHIDQEEYSKGLDMVATIKRQVINKTNEINNAPTITDALEMYRTTLVACQETLNAYEAGRLPLQPQIVVEQSRCFPWPFGTSRVHP